MTFKRFLLGTLIVVAPAVCSPAEPDVPRQVSQEILQYSGMSDASAAVALDDATFLVADDEQNTLRVYRWDQCGAPRQLVPWGEHLGIAADDEHPEADIEGATTLGGHIYWITSHGRNKDGKWRSNRHRFFAMTVTMTGDRVVAEPFGKPCRTLIGNLTRDPRMRDLRLGKALGLGIEKSEKLAPKEKGLNVEGLCATADGTSLLIGFRNPCPDGKALLVPLRNPAEVLTERAPPDFSDPIRLDLAVRPEGKSIALGIRSIEYSKRHGGYLILAGPNDEEKLFALYLWSGNEDDQPKLLSKSTAAIDPIDKFTPEALIVYPQQDKIQLLSDDGTLKVKVGSPAECREGTFENGECEAKFLLDDGRKTFRSIRVAVE